MDEREQDWEVSVSYKCNICGIFESRTSALFTHSFEVHFYKSFCCHVCNVKPFRSIVELSDHIEEAHRCFGFTQMACSICKSFFFNNLAQLNSHVIASHWTVKPVQSCLLCNYKSEKDIETHIESSHNGFKCNIYRCNFMDRNVNNLLKHILNLHFPKLILFYSCLICGREFDEWNLAHNHLANSHSTFVDNEPAKYVTNSHVLGEVDVDKRNAVQYFKYIVQLHCNLCKYICQKRTIYINHMEQRHSNFSIKCPFKKCKFRNNKFWALCGHVSSKHLMGTKYKCPECCQFFPSLEIGLQHGSSAHGKRKLFFQKIVFCNLCNIEISSKKDDFSHFTLVHGLDFPKEIALLFDNEANSGSVKVQEPKQEVAAGTSGRLKHGKSVEELNKRSLKANSITEPPRPLPRSILSPQVIQQVPKQQNVPPQQQVTSSKPTLPPPPLAPPTYTRSSNVYSQPASSYPVQSYSSGNQHKSYQQGSSFHQRHHKSKNDCIIL